MEAESIIDVEVEEFDQDVADPGPIASIRTPSPEGQSPRIEVFLWDNKLLFDAEDERAGEWNDGDLRFSATLEGEGQEFTAEECRQWAAALLKAAELLETIDPKATA